MNKNTYLSVSLVVLLILGTLWVKDGQSKSLSSVGEVKVELSHYKEIQGLGAQLLSAKLETLSELVKSTAIDRYTGHDHKVFADRLQELNPTMKVPRQEK